jgi:hypothetical protein
MEWPSPTLVVMNVYFEERNTEHETPLIYTCFTVKDQHSMEKHRNDNVRRIAVHVSVIFEMQVRILNAMDNLPCRKCYCDTENFYSEHLFTHI